MERQNKLKQSSIRHHYRRKKEVEWIYMFVDEDWQIANKRVSLNLIMDGDCSEQDIKQLTDDLNTSCKGVSF
jgi:hypothetical protein